MCGIVGLVEAQSSWSTDVQEVLRRMTGQLARRGPDQEGFWNDERVGVHLGFRRLAIQDLSELGHQPMRSPTGRFTMVFNGEVYNFHALRDELRQAGHSFRGGSDTEVILAAFEEWGVEASIRRTQGMFGIAVYDAERRELFLVRDRIGIKPLYLWARHGSIAFGSELRALFPHPDVERRGSREAAWHYLRRLSVPAPLSMLEGVEKVMPGTIVRFTLDETGVRNREDLTYWDLLETQRGTPVAPESEEDAVERMHDLILGAVRDRLVADVPVGALLSGGIDSSLVVAMMQASSSKPVRTFTIRFDDPRFDEGPAAQAVADVVGTTHTEIDLPTARLPALVPDLPTLSDEPMANPSLLPTLLVCETARAEVTVALAGDGGDELFGGYNRYLLGARAIEARRKIPSPLRPAAAALLRGAGKSSLVEALVARVSRGKLGQQHSASARFLRTAQLLGAASEREAYEELLSVGYTMSGSAPSTSFASDGAFDQTDTLPEAMMLHDQLQYMPDDLLAKIDRASMWVSLEARVPFLDHRVVEASWSLPLSVKIRNGRGKWLLRELAARYIPREVLDRPKMGFTVPLNDWLHGELSGWVAEHLDPQRAKRRGLLDPNEVSGLHRELTSQRSDVSTSVWAVAVLEAWCEEWGVTFDR